MSEPKKARAATIQVAKNGYQIYENSGNNYTVAGGERVAETWERTVAILRDVLAEPKEKPKLSAREEMEALVNGGRTNEPPKPT